MELGPQKALIGFMGLGPSKISQNIGNFNVFLVFKNKIRSLWAAKDKQLVHKRPAGCQFDIPALDFQIH
jgi:hypothetical protein